MKIQVVGLGKAGLPFAAIIADAGFDVIGLDLNKQLVEQINDGVNPFPEEPGLDELIKKYGGKRLRATSDPKTAATDTQMHIILVPLLLDGKNQPDFKYVDAAFNGVVSGLKKGDVIVLETTLPVGTTENRYKPLLEKSGFKVGKDVFLAYSPERLMSGFAISRFRDFPKVLGGVDPASAKKALEIYVKILPQTKLVANARTAEMIKIAEGVYRDVNIAVANELFKCCQENEVDFSEVRQFANHKFCHIHEAGIGVGGHCIPVYPWFLINNADAKGKKTHVKTIRAAREVNDEMVLYWKDGIITELKRSGVRLNKLRICIYGLTYRKGVKELYHTRSIPLITELQKEGLNVFGFDDLLSKGEVEGLGLRFSRPEDCDFVFMVHEGLKLEKS
ncbi:nucleotide sugar dehydrogenase [Candidatus Micrarchaeota archaeon]|nr:nucleotide sugar dehydrogenase [Candidatus Micrarchaeota archaeon]